LSASPFKSHTNRLNTAFYGSWPFAVAKVGDEVLAYRGLNLSGIAVEALPIAQCFKSCESDRKQHLRLAGNAGMGPWLISQLQQQKRIQPLPGFGYSGVAIKAKRKELLALLGRGLSRVSSRMQDVDILPSLKIARHAPVLVPRPQKAVIGNSQDGTGGKHGESPFPESAHWPSLLHCDT
jgi:hypothetical protein